MSEIEDEKYTSESFDNWAQNTLSSVARKWLYGTTEEILLGLYWAYVTGAKKDTLPLTAFVIESYAKGNYGPGGYTSDYC